MDGAFRAPLPESTAKFKRGAQATYGEVRAIGNIRGSTVTDDDGKQIDIKWVKAVPLASTGAHGRFGAVNDRLQTKKREQAGLIIEQLCKILEDRDQISLAAAAGLMRDQLPSYDDILRATSLVDLVRLAPDRLKLVQHGGSGAREYYYVALAD